MTVKYMSNVKLTDIVLPKVLVCASCTKAAVLVKKLATITNSQVQFDLLSYDCSCGESFTTTESDTISLKNYTTSRRIHNRKELRKEKIIKCTDNQIEK